jgi:RNA polymerase sigma-70 factor (ECF subfamily)
MALSLLDQTMALLLQEYTTAGKSRLFEKIKDFLAGNHPRGGYGLIAAELEMTEGALKVAVHRARRRFGDLLRVEVAVTVASPEDVQHEIRYLLAVLDG